MFTLYHIEGVKIGCSKNLKRRINEQGFNNFEILEEHTDIYLASAREIELQKQYGYKVDKIPYYESIKRLNKAQLVGGFREGHTPWNDGIACSLETKEKISLGNSGRKQSDEEKEKRRLSAEGNKSEEYKKEQSERIKEWWRLRKQKLN
jgi:hypothetical protein